MNKTQYIVLAKKTIRSDWKVIFALDKAAPDSYEQALSAWKKFNGYKCIVLESRFGSYINEKEVSK